MFWTTQVLQVFVAPWGTWDLVSPPRIRLKRLSPKKSNATGAAVGFGTNQGCVLTLRLERSVRDASLVPFDQYSIWVNASTWHVSSETTNSNVSIATSMTVVGECRWNYFRMSSALNYNWVSTFRLHSVTVWFVWCILQTSDVQHGVFKTRMGLLDSSCSDQMTTNKTRQRKRKAIIYDNLHQSQFFFVWEGPVLIHAVGICWIEFT